MKPSCPTENLNEGRAAEVTKEMKLKSLHEDGTFLTQYGVELKKTSMFLNNGVCSKEKDCVSGESKKI